MTRLKVLGPLLCFAGLGCLVSAAQAQQMTYTLSGLVRDAEGGAGLPNVRVMVQGTRYGVLTNQAGAYTIVAQLDAGRYTIVAQSIGRQSGSHEVALGADRLVNLPDLVMRAVALSLEEIVVTGTAAPTARRALGNAVSSVAEEQLASAPAMTIDQALQGKVAGAMITSNTGTPGGGVSVRLRGTSSIVGGAEPLYIVDGVIIDNNADQQINLGYRSNASNRLADLDPNDIERVEIVKGAAAAALYGSRANNGVVQIFTKRGRAGVNRVTVGTRVTRSDLERRIAFALTPLDTLGNTVTRYDHQDLIFREPLSTDTYVSMSGGSPETQYYLSGNFLSQNGIMQGADHQKLNVRMNLDQRVSSWLNLSAGANYIRSHTNLVINGEQGAGGLLTAIVFTPTTVNLAARDSVTGLLVNQLAGPFPNPLTVLESWKSPQDINRFVGSVGLNATFGSLALSYRLGYDQYGMETGLTIPRGDVSTPLGSSTDLNRRNVLANNDVVGNYDYQAGSGLRLTTSAGLNHTYQRVDQLNAGSSDLPPQIDLVRGAVQSASQARWELVTLGFFGQQQVSFKDRIYLTGALRWDASSTFGADERWQMYPKLSASWMLSEESFVQNGLPWISELRLRGALGYAGNQPPLASAYERATRYTTITNINRLGLAPTGSPGNPNLKPERQREWEGGIDLALLDNRIGARFTYYDQYVKDLLLTRPFTPSAGYNSVLDNVGELSNRGLELEVNTINVNKNTFGWTSRIIYSRNRNKVEKLVGSPFVAGYTNLVVQGQPVGVHFMAAYRRDGSGTIVTDSIGPLLESRIGRDTTVDECLDLATCLANDTRRVVGNPWPDWTGSLFNEVRLGRHVTVAALLDGSFGSELWNQTARIQDGFQAGPLYDQRLRNEVTTPQVNRLRSIWERYLEDATYVKLRDLAVRYSTEASWLRRIGAQRLELELIGHNLFTWTDYTGYDPEINMFGLSTVERGTDFAVYPNARSIGFGVRLSY